MTSEDLKEIAVLQQIDAQARTRLASVLQEKDYKENQTVFAEGDPGDSMYFIIKGGVRIEKLVQGTSGSRKTLAVLQAGDYFGEMSLVEQKPRSASAVTAPNTRLLRLSKSAFDEIQKESNAAGMSVLFGMIRTSSERIRRLSSQVIVYDEVGKAIGEARDLQALLDVILQQLSSATLADWGLLVLRSQFSEGVEVRSQVNLPLSAKQREEVSKGHGFLESALRQPQDQLIGFFAEQGSLKSCARLGFETASMLIAPIVRESQILGLIVLGGQERDQFDLNDLNLARGVACQAAQAILNARHHEEQQARLRHSHQFVRF